jgi:hypothetical protein
MCVTGSEKQTNFSDEDGKAVVHLQMACAGEDETIAGCIRQGVRVW